jgi:hypothetical protein
LKRRGFIPSSANFTATDFFKVVDDETQTYIVPLLMSVREDYLVATEDITVTSGVTAYDLPIRAIGGKLRNLQYADSAGSIQTLVRLEPERVDSFDPSISLVAGYYLQGNTIILTGTPVSGTLRATYYRRPNRVVATTAVYEITSVAGTTVNGGTPPSTYATSNLTYDLISGTPGFDSFDDDVTLSAVGGSSVTLTTANTSIARGDYVCLAGETPIPQIPVELQPLLAQRVTATVLHALGDAKAENAYGVADKMEARVLKLITPRVEGSSRPVINRFGVGARRRY